MSWRDNLRDASFRGVPFKVASTDNGFGRRNVLHQYPMRNIPYVEDLGEDVDEYSVRGYVIQNIDNNFDYFNERDALITALKTSGPGTLVHPFLGEVQVTLLGKARVSEDFSEGGIARFDMSFIQAGESKYPESSTDPKQAMDDAASSAFSKIKDEFGNFYEVAGAAIDTAVSDLTTATSMMKRAMLGVKGAVTSAISKASNLIDTAVTNLGLTVYTVCSIGDMVDNSLSNFLGIIGIPNPIVDAAVGVCSGENRGTVYELDGESVPQSLGSSLVDSFVGVSDFGEDADAEDQSPYGGTLVSITINTENKAREALNRLYTVNMVRSFTLINACKVAARIDYESYDEASSVMETIVDAIDNQIEELGSQGADDTYASYGLAFDNSESYNALEDLRAVFVKIMTEIGADLAKVIDYKVPVNLYTTLEVAYNEYNDITRDVEIFDRNKPFVEHPGFLPAGKTIEILSR